jgi:hypothetical protein
MQDLFDTHRRKLLMLNIITAHIFVLIGFLTEFNFLEALASTAMIGWLLSALWHFIVITTFEFIIIPATRVIAVLTSQIAERNTPKTQRRPLP